jgi:hypothetical protein
VAIGGFFVKCPQCAARTKVTERGLKAQPLVACRCGVAFMPQVSAGAAAGRNAVVVLDASRRSASPCFERQTVSGAR